MAKTAIYENYCKFSKERKDSSSRITKNIRLSSVMHKELIDYCNEEGFNKSNLVHQFMRDYLKYCQKNIDFYPLSMDDYVIIQSNFGIDLKHSVHLERRPFAFRVNEHLYQEFCEMCEMNKKRICDVLEESIASYLIQERRLSVARVTKYNRLAEELHTAFAGRCKILGIGKSELMEYFFTYYMENSQNNRTFRALAKTDYAKVKTLYNTDLEHPTHIPRIICAFRLYEDLYNRFCEQCSQNSRRLCDVIEEMMAAFLLETEEQIKK